MGFGDDGTGTPTQIISAPSNARFAHIYSGQLYGTSGSSPFTGVFSVGSGKPTGATTATILNGFPTTGASPYSFAVLDVSSGTPGVDTIYLALDSAPATGTINVQKWLLVGSTWTLQSWAPAFSTTVGVRGLAAVQVAGGVRVVAATSDGAKLVTFLDTGPSPAATPLATVLTNTAYRGLAFSPAP